MAERLKDIFFQKPFFESLGAQLKSVYTDFDHNGFINDIYDDTWDERELKQRMSHTSKVLRKHLPDDYIQSLEILEKVAPSFKGFDAMVFSDFVEQFGIDHFDESIKALVIFTELCSAEFAIRPFIVKYPDQTMQKMMEWSKSDNEHLRRLSSEGCRPRLPWAMALPLFKKDPSPILPILENLKNDPEEYVRRSVANNLNDISKDHPKLMTSLLRKWNDNPAPGTQWIIKYALRGLLKAGDPDALDLLGFGEGDVSISNLSLDPTVVHIGEALKLSFDLQNEGKGKTRLMIDYIIHFKKANDRNAPKVFKLKTCELAAGERISINKKISFMPISTRKYYSGTHQVDIQVNGKVLGRKTFELLAG